MPDEQSQRLVIGVTGATGCIGRMLVRHLLRIPSVEVRALVRRPGVRRQPGLSIRAGDLYARGALESLVAESDVVLHLAAQNPISAEEDRRQLATFLATNSFGTGAVAHLAREHDTPLIYTSSVAVYELGEGTSGPIEEDESLPGRRDTTAWSERALESLEGIVGGWASGREKDPLRAVNRILRDHPPPPSESVYGLSKFLGEQWVTPMAKGLVLRLSDVYGPGHEARGILQEYLRQVLQGKPVTVDFGPRARVSFIYLRDVLLALLRSALLVKAPATPVINIANPTSVSQDQLRHVLLALDGRAPIAVQAPPASPLPGSTRPFATQHAERLLGVRWTSLADGMRETLGYLDRPIAERGEFQFPGLRL